MADEIEFEDPTFSTCECCGSNSTHLVRFVTRDGDAFASYYADFSSGHDFVSVLVGFGEWGDNATPDDRTAFALNIWVAHNSFQVGLIDAADAFRSTATFFGKILDREEALAHPLTQELFDLSDHIVICDRPIIEFLEGGIRAS